MKVTRENASLLVFYFLLGNNIFFTASFSKNIKGSLKFSRVLVKVFLQIEISFSPIENVYIS